MLHPIATKFGRKRDKINTQSLRKFQLQRFNVAYTTLMVTRYFCGFCKWKMASTSKRPLTALQSTERVLELLEEDNNSDDGMSSGEESDLDLELQKSKWLIEASCTLYLVACNRAHGLKKWKWQWPYVVYIWLFTLE